MDWLDVVRPITCLTILVHGMYNPAVAQQPLTRSTSTNHSAAQARMRPLGSASAVDSFSAHPTTRSHADASTTRVTMMQVPVDSQPMAPPSLPAGGFSFPSNAAQPLPNNITPAPSSGGIALPSNGLPAPLQSSPSAGPIGLPPSLQPQPTTVDPRVITPAPTTSVPVSPSTIVPRTSAPQTLPVNPNVAPPTSPVQSPPIVVGPRTTVTPGTVVNPGTSVPRMAPSATVPNAFGPAVNPPSASDYAAIPQPQLDNAFATMDNCRNITGPSTYRAAGFFGCNQPATYTSPVYGPPVYGAPTTYVPPPSQIAPAVALPPSATYSPVGLAGSVPPVLPGSPGYRPLFTLGQEKNPVQVGQGFWGQPVAYVPGQTIRNGLRYLSF